MYYIENPTFATAITVVADCSLCGAVNFTMHSVVYRRGGGRALIFLEPQVCFVCVGKACALCWFSARRGALVDLSTADHVERGVFVHFVHFGLRPSHFVVYCWACRDCINAFTLSALDSPAQFFCLPGGIIGERGATTTVVPKST